jgi:hypothetical protein
VVVQDTAERIVDTKYYGNTEEGMCAALGELRDCGCSFVVVGRADKGRKFFGLADISMPQKIQSMFIGLTEEDFRLDLSSSDIRNGKQS